MSGQLEGMVRGRGCQRGMDPVFAKNTSKDVNDSAVTLGGQWGACRASLFHP